MSKKTTIRIAVAGVGSCASALIQGVQWYRNNPDQTVGLMYTNIGGYGMADLNFVIGFDVDVRKINQPLSRAIYAKPNCNMRVSSDVLDAVEYGAVVHQGPRYDGVAPHMEHYPEGVSFRPASDEGAISAAEYQALLKEAKVDVLLNYMPVGAEEASAFYIKNAIEAGVHVVNCMPSFISTEDAKMLEAMAIEHKTTIVGSDMRSAWGASRLSEVLQGAMLDAGLVVTQHIQMNMAAGTTQGMEDVRTGRTANTDFLNMAVKERLVNKHISKENVLTGQNVVRDQGTEGMTMYAGPSLTVLQRPGAEYVGSDNKIANLDIVAYGWAGARYELTSRLSVQDSPNSSGIVADAIRFCKVASEEGVVGYLRGPSAYSQKTSPTQMKSADAKFECDALARRVITPLVAKQLLKNNPQVENLEYTFQDSKTAYDK